MDFLQKNFLFITVFITGAAVLIIEVTATRILAPYFGNTLFSISSIIGVILGALSLGYYLGGILADRSPRFSIFFFLIFLAGVFSFLIQGLSKVVLITLGYSLDIKIGPPVASMILFFIPSLILGTMSPFAIKLKSLESKEVGKVSGTVFFWSTLGSITGSFAAGFFLIPRLGVSAIIILTGAGLVIIGIFGYLFFKDEKEKNYLADKKVFFFLAFTAFFGLASFFMPGPPYVIFQKDGLYSQITIKEERVGQQRVRFLLLDKGLEGGIFLESNDLPFEYTRYYSIYNVLNPRAKTALFLGGGPYSVPRSLLLDNNNIQRVDVVEIEPELYQIAKTYFNLPDDPRFFNHIADGRRFLAKTDRDYDIIFADVYYSLYSIPVHFTTEEFFTLAKNRLSPEGFLLMNVIGSLGEESNQFTLAELKTFKSVFKNSYFFAVDSPDKKDLQNFIFLGFKDDFKKIDFNDSKFARNDREIIRDLSKKLINQDALGLNAAPLLTDNFSPVEYLISKVF